jgi:hypothetical protein
MRPWKVMLAAVAATIALSGCSSVTLTAGANLAKVGQTTADQMEQNATISVDAMSGLRKAVAFNDGFNNAIGNPASASFLKSMTDVQTKVSQYAKMLESLSAAYAALGDLASYDAVGGFNTAYAALVKDSNQFLQTTGTPKRIPATASSVVAAGAGVFVGYVQAEKVKDASRAIEKWLRAIIPILDDPATRKLLILNKQAAVAQISQAAATLFATGVYSYDPLLDVLGAPLNLKSTAQSDAVVAKNPKIKSGLSNVAIELANEQSDQIAAAYDASVAALKALLPLHQSLENGAPLNLGTLQTIVDRLQSIATSIETTKGK